MQPGYEEHDSNVSAWRFRWPNTADFNFDYYRLLDERPIGLCPPAQKIKIAIVGAGVAGLTAARELYRSGYHNIHIYEATPRIGGRAWSELAPGRKYTVYEGGAMRLPFFIKPEDHNCVLDYYRKIFSLKTERFPNPGRSDVCHTGIYRNGKWGVWKKGDSPPREYKEIHKKWVEFKERFQKVAREHYERGHEAWREFWFKVVGHYSSKRFEQLVEDPPQKDVQKQAATGDFGGMGLPPDDSTLFRIVGAGDGGWGSFYDRGALWVIRTLLCGFGDNLQLIAGSLAKNTLGRGPDSYDPLSKKYRPRYLGVQALAECLYFEPTDGSTSLHKAKDTVDLRLQSTVTCCSLVDESKSRQLKDIEVSWIDKRQIEDGEKKTEKYNVVILTPSISVWSKITLNNFDANLEICMDEVRESAMNSHMISSCKIFFPLRTRYWDKDEIPQVLVTDEWTRDTYGYAVDGDDGGVLLASYTWEDDTNRLSSKSDIKLGEECLEKLDEILKRSDLSDFPGMKEGISSFIDTDVKPKVRVFRWLDYDSYKGCAKLSSPGSLIRDYRLLAFNQKCGKRTGLYLAGEAVSVEGGWLEPALRSALDAVINIVNDTGGSFPHPEFQFKRDYPQYMWPPDVSNVTDQVPQVRCYDPNHVFWDYLLDLPNVGLDATIAGPRSFEDWKYWLGNFKKSYEATMHVSPAMATGGGPKEFEEIRSIQEKQTNKITRYYLYDTAKEIDKWAQMIAIDKKARIRSGQVLKSELLSAEDVRHAISVLGTDDFALIDGNLVRCVLHTDCPESPGNEWEIRISTRITMVQAAKIVLAACKSYKKKF